MKVSEEQRQKIAMATSNLRRKPNRAIMGMVGLNNKKPVTDSPGLLTLPQPFMAFEGDALTENINKAALQFRREEDPDLLALYVLLDETRTQEKYDTDVVDGEVVVVGGQFPDKGIIRDEKEELDLALCSTQVMEVVVKRVDSPEVLPISSLPFGPNTCNKTTMLALFIGMVECFMSSPEAYLAGIGFDGYAAFYCICMMLLGLVALPKTGFWNQLQQLPSPILRWPFGAVAARHQRAGTWRILFGSTDMLHLLKGLVWAMRSHVRSIRLGHLHCDPSAFIAYGLPLLIFRGKDRQADREANLYLLFLRALTGEILPHMFGCLVLNFVVSLVSVAWLSKTLTLMHRHVVASMAFYFLRMCRNYLEKIGKEKGCVNLQ